MGTACGDRGVAMTPARGACRAAMLALVLAALGGCAAVGVGYGGPVGSAYIGGYYEPYGYPYGGWGPGYRVGPPRGGVHRAPPRQRPYRAAPGNRPTPSLPSRPPRPHR